MLDPCGSGLASTTPWTLGSGGCGTLGSSGGGMVGTLLGPEASGPHARVTQVAQPQGCRVWVWGCVGWCFVAGSSLCLSARVCVLVGVGGVVV